MIDVSKPKFTNDFTLLNKVPAFLHCLRSGSAWGFSEGILVSFAADTVRLCKGLGILREGLRTNQILYSRTFSNAAWTKTNTTVTANRPGLDAAVDTAFTLEATADNGTLVQTKTLSSDKFTLSFYFRTNYEDQAPDTEFVYSIDGSTEYRITSSPVWQRIELTDTLANPQAYIKLLTDGDSIVIDQVQIEAGGFASSPIITSGSTVTRQADQLFISDYIKGDYAWFNATAGTFEITASVNLDQDEYTLMYLRNNDDTGDYLKLGFDKTSTRYRFQAGYTTSVLYQINNNDYDPDRDGPANRFTLTTAYKDGLQLFSANGVDPVLPVFAQQETIDFSDVDKIWLGYDTSGNHLFGYIEQFTYYNTFLTINQTIGATLNPPLIAVTDFSDTITVGWSAVQDVEGYLIDVATDSGFSSMVVGYNNLDIGNVTSYEITGLTGDVLYYIRVRSYYDALVSDNSNVVSQYTILIPDAPVIAITDATDDSIEVGWSAVTGAVGYAIDVSTNSGFSSFIINNLDIGNVTSYDITGLTTNVLYYIRVRTYNNFSISDDSNTVSQLTYDTTAEVLFAQYVTTVGSSIPLSYRAIYNQLFLDLKGIGTTGAADLISKLDFIRGLVGYTTSSDTSQDNDNRFLLRCDILNPSGLLMSNVTGGLNIGKRAGWSDSNVKSYRLKSGGSAMSSRENDATTLSQYTTTQATKGMWHDDTLPAIVCGLEGANNATVSLDDTVYLINTFVRPRVNGFSNTPTISNLVKGMRTYIIGRTTNSFHHYINDTENSLGPASSFTGQNLPNDTLYFGNSKNYSSPWSGSTEMYKLVYFKGAVMSTAEQSQLYNSLKNYMTSMGLASFY